MHGRLVRRRVFASTEAAALDVLSSWSGLRTVLEVESIRSELRTQLHGAWVALRSRTADLVRQEFWSLALAHFAVRGLMHEAALQAGEDPDTLATLGASRLSFLHAMRVVRRKGASAR